ncbi:PE-PGRS family protein PE_PGRS33-like isoform X24 [Crotalus tigris]|uniref:PE-PGRS family protein PE_PGRS33-like isoform X24 n=1 Tax=Crotalus tigris TaxID=88082 RepID=UPI00192F16B6|nr:PE-PGRS family protein PE_PGRS33-like isoform X24 [Crotalus tigris]
MLLLLIFALTFTLSAQQDDEGGLGGGGGDGLNRFGGPLSGLFGGAGGQGHNSKKSNGGWMGMSGLNFKKPNSGRMGMSDMFGGAGGQGLFGGAGGQGHNSKKSNGGWMGMSDGQSSGGMLGLLGNLPGVLSSLTSGGAGGQSMLSGGGGENLPGVLSSLTSGGAGGQSMLSGGGGENGQSGGGMLDLLGVNQYTFNASYFHDICNVILCVHNHSHLLRASPMKHLILQEF